MSQGGRKGEEMLRQKVKTTKKKGWGDKIRDKRQNAALERLTVKEHKAQQIS